MGNLFNQFMATYGLKIIELIVAAVFSYVGVAIKHLITKYVNDDVKRSVARDCVMFVEQVYTDVHGEEKLNTCIGFVSSMLTEKGINITENEIRILIEAAVKELNASLSK